MFLRRRRTTAAGVHLAAGGGLHARAGSDLVVVGAHGGAGASTLATLLRPAWDMGAINALLEPGRPPVRAKGRPIVVVTRNTVSAAWHATRAVTAIELEPGAADQCIAALVIVGDGAGLEPREATARFALLQDRVGGVVWMPFVPALRLADDATEVELPAKARHALQSILDLASGQPCR